VPPSLTGPYSFIISDKRLRRSGIARLFSESTSRRVVSVVLRATLRMLELAWRSALRSRRGDDFCLDDEVEDSDGVKGVKLAAESLSLSLFVLVFFGLDWTVGVLLSSFCEAAHSDREEEIATFLPPEDFDLDLLLFLLEEEGGGDEDISCVNLPRFLP